MMDSVRLISLPEWYQNEAETVNMLFERGLTAYHLRKNRENSVKHHFESFLSKIKESYYPRIFIHNEHWLLKYYGIGGLHFNANTGFDIPQIVRSGKWRLSAAAHSIEECLQLPLEIQDVLLSPVYDSFSKTGYTSAFPDKNRLGQELGRIKKERPQLKLFALGGVGKEQIREVFSTGFDGLAMLGSVWQFTNNQDVSMTATLDKWEEIKELVQSL